MKKTGKIILYFLAGIVGLFAIFLIFISVADYSPEDKIILAENKDADEISDTSEVSIMIWNIGYCGLSAEMDFFYDGGEMVRPLKEQVPKNLDGVLSFLEKNETTDFILLQEVDKGSRRSHYVNQYDAIHNKFPEKKSSFGKNYDVSFVPLPVTNPMGKVLSGILTLSSYQHSDATRYQFPGNYDWPKGLFMLDRCFVVNRYPVSNGKELLIINTHNSAYDDGSLKAGQMEYLKKLLEEEYSNGNYIAVGGDWNQCPPEFEATFSQNIMDNKSRTDIDKNYLKKWAWLYDSSVPTNRRVATKYEKGKSLTTVIDFFLLSPNLEAVSIENINLDFKNSDHQPVKAVFKFK